MVFIEAHAHILAWETTVLLTSLFLVIKNFFSKKNLSCIVLREAMVKGKPYSSSKAVVNHFTMT